MNYTVIPDKLSNKFLRHVHVTHGLMNSLRQKIAQKRILHTAKIFLENCFAVIYYNKDHVLTVMAAKR